MVSDRNFQVNKMLDFLIENDLQFTVPLTESVRKQGLSLAQYAEKLCKKGTVAYSLSKDGRVEGMVIGYTHDLPEDRASYITQVVTAPDFCKKGVCSALLLEYIDFCRDMDIGCVWLTTDVNNAAARKCYESFGFERASYNDDSRVKYVYKL